jgi:hypothetical protein
VKTSFGCEKYLKLIRNFELRRRRLLTTYFFDNFFLDFSLCSKTQELFGILSEVR